MPVAVALTGVAVRSAGSTRDMRVKIRTRTESTTIVMAVE